MTSRYSPVNHMRIGPFGVCISIDTRRVPPTRTSIFATGMVAPAGPYHAAKCSGSVHIRQMRSTGAAKRRSITTASADALASVMCSPAFRCGLELLEVGVHPVEAGLPDGSVLLGPCGDRFEWRAVEGARPVLRLVPASDQPGPFQHLDVLGDG